MTMANMAIDPGKARAITDYVAANPDATNREVAASLGMHESAVRRAKAARGVMQAIAIQTIRTDGGTQFREAVNEDVAHEYAEAYKQGEKLPAPVVFQDSEGNRWLGDGFTRVRAAVLASLPDLDCELRDGTLEDAILYAAGANERHGQRRTKPDRHRAIEAALKLRPELSNRDIANICRVSHELVRIVRHRVDPKFELKPDPLPVSDEQSDEPKPHKPAKNQPEFFPDPVEYDRKQKDKHAQDLGFDNHEDMELEEYKYAVATAVGLDAIDSAACNEALKNPNRTAWEDVKDELGLDDEIEVEETTADGGPVDEFAAWLASLPLNGKLQGTALTKFNADARFYWEFTKSPEFKAFEKHVANFTKSIKAGLAYHAVDRFKRSLVHPRDWKLCAECSGQCCPSCFGRGYHA